MGSLKAAGVYPAFRSFPSTESGNVQEATVGKLCTTLTDLGRHDAVQILMRTVPLYIVSGGLDEATQVV